MAFSGRKGIELSELDSSLQQLIMQGSTALGLAQQAATDVATLQQNVAQPRNVTNDTLDSGKTLGQELADLRQLILDQGGSAPEFGTPSVPTTDATGADIGDTVTITPAEVLGSYTQVRYRIYYETNDAGTQTGLTFVVQSAWAYTSSRTIRVVQEVLWSGGIVAASSDAYVLAVPPAVPQKVTAPSISGTSPNLTLNAGTWTNTPDDYTFKLYRGAVSNNELAAGPTTQAGTTLAYTVVSDDAGASLTLSVVANKSGVGSSIEEFATPVTIPGGSAPTYNSSSAVLPGFVADVNKVGETLTLNFGAPINTANSFTYQMFRNGVPITGQGVPPAISADHGVDVANNQTYFITSSDQDCVLSFSVYARNGNGISETVYSAGIYIDPADVGGGGGVLTFGTAASPGAPDSLTTYGSSDWAVFDNATFASADQKASSGAATITGITAPAHDAIGAGTYYDWTDGTPNGTYTAKAEVGGYSVVNPGVSDGGPITITMNADATQRTAYLWIIVNAGRATIGASLSDASASPAQTTIDSGAGTWSAWRLPLVYKAASGSQTLTVTVTPSALYGTYMYAEVDAAAIGS